MKEYLVGQLSANIVTLYPNMDMGKSLFKPLSNMNCFLTCLKITLEGCINLELTHGTTRRSVISNFDSRSAMTSGVATDKMNYNSLVSLSKLN